jgi:vacuolar-type H+-ATPase subunit E/Vma4
MTGRPTAGAVPAPATPGIRQRAAEPTIRAALAPVRAAMLRRAQDQADEIAGQARRQAADAVARARADADESVALAREAGLAQAAPLAAAVRNQRRRDARATVLATQREAYEELRERVRAAVSALRDEPGYGQLLERLRHSAREAAGQAAMLTEDPAGGIVARGPGVVVDCSLPRLADAAVEALGPEADWLWTPGRRRERGAGAPSGRGTSAGPRGRS